MEIDSYHRPTGGLIWLTFSSLVGVLAEGFHTPLLCEANLSGAAAGLWVVKPWISDRARNASMVGQLMAVRELAGAHFFAHLGVPVPTTAIIRLPSEIPPLEHLEPWAQVMAAPILRENAGRLAVCSLHLRAADFNLAAFRSRRCHTTLHTDAPTILMGDWYLHNGDRLGARPNMLIHRNRLVAIDHGNAFSQAAAMSSCCFLPGEHALYGPVRTRVRRGKIAAVELEEWGGRFRAGVASLPLDHLLRVWPDEFDEAGRTDKTC